MKRLFLNILRRLRRGEDLVLCSIIASSGSTPRGSGAKMAVFSDGSAEGTIGGGAVEYESTRLAKTVLDSKTSFVKGYDLTSNQTADIGMICGGSVVVYFQYFSGGDTAAIDMFGRIVSLFEENTDSWLITQITEGGVRQMGVYEKGRGLKFLSGISDECVRPFLKGCGKLYKGEPSYYVEPLTQAGLVYIFGGGHISRELVPVIAHVGFRPVVYEDREDFSDPKRFPDAVRTVTAPFTEIAKHVSISEKDYAVILTRGHQMDFAVLEQALRTGASYIGVIGSHSKIAETNKKLIGAGIPPEDLRRVHAPIGLPIKGETPAEIAISIAAELILHRAEKAAAEAGI